MTRPPRAGPNPDGETRKAGCQGRRRRIEVSESNCRRIGDAARLRPLCGEPLHRGKAGIRARHARSGGRSGLPGVRNPVVGIDFYINNQLYDEQAVPTTVALGECEEWHIIVPSGEHGGTEGHPFHIHVNDFEVKAIAGIEQRQGLIQDTIWVQQNTASVIRMRFKEWTGKSVFHCHILPHEDTGMMQNFLILDKRPPMDMGEKSIKSLRAGSTKMKM